MPVVTDAQQLERRSAIMRILREGQVRRQEDLVRLLRLAGPTLTVLRTTIGAAQSVAVAIDRADWPEVAGTLSGDDTIFIATASATARDKLVDRLRALFPV